MTKRSVGLLGTVALTGTLALTLVLGCGIGVSAPPHVPPDSSGDNDPGGGGQSYLDVEGVLQFADAPLRDGRTG